MSKGFGYLKPNVVAARLVDACYAWTHLLPSATGARNLTARHSPHIPLANPTMPGGPFAGQEPRLQRATNIKYSGESNSICYASHVGKTRRLRGITAKRPFENKEILLS